MPNNTNPRSLTSHNAVSERVRTYIEDETSASFDDIALATIRSQAGLLPSYRRLFDARGVDPDAITHWQQAPPIPTRAFQSQVFNIGGTEHVFRSSGTTTSGHRRSEHHHGNLDLYRRIVDASFPAAVLGAKLDAGLLRRPILSLVAPMSLIDDSSLGFHDRSRYGPLRQWRF